MKAVIELVERAGSRPPWVRRLRGVGPAGLIEDPIPWQVDYSRANNYGSRGVRRYFLVEEGQIYHVSEPKSHGRSEEHFCRVVSGKVVRIPRQEAIREIEAHPPTAAPAVVSAPPPARRGKRPLGKSVLVAAQERIAYAFDHFPRVYLSFSAGKDSTVMLHMVAEEARQRGRKFGLLLIDLEAQYKLTIDHGLRCFEEYADCTEPFWISLPILLRNAVSQYEPRWLCWDPERRADWVREPPPLAITDPRALPFFRPGEEFEEFVIEFGHWYGQGQLTCCLVGIRADESLNRYRTLTADKARFENLCWTTYKGEALYNAYPLYDWRTEDIWTYTGKFRKSYNALYDRMSRAGLTIHQQRICQPYGDDQRKGLWLFHVIEQETWARVVARVNGANAGALYAQETGNILGRIKISKPEGHTWRSFATLLLESLPPRTRQHFEDKIATFLHWHSVRGATEIPDEADPALEAAHKAPSWRRICKALLRNDYWCKGLSFTQTKSDSYHKYKKIMQARRSRWGMTW